MGATKLGKRLSASTASTSATRSVGSGGSASASFSPRLVATIFSPSRSMKIPDTEIEPPSTRTMPRGSTAARTRASKKRPLASSVPTGPANRATPPSRATAMAALAAQPPAVAANASAWTFPPGSGKRSTLNRKSSTAMPAQSTTAGRRRSLPLSEFNAVLHPTADDMVGDRERLRRGEAGGMRPCEYQTDLFAREPASVVELGAIEDNLVRECFGMAADHQRGRKRPRLRGEIADAPAHDAGF